MLSGITALLFAVCGLAGCSGSSETSTDAGKDATGSSDASTKEDSAQSIPPGDAGADSSDGDACGPNLLVNGSFEQGNTGFTSDYQYVTTSDAAGQYGITVDPMMQASPATTGPRSVTTRQAPVSC
jgi:hypothetical protein